MNAIAFQTGKVILLLKRKNMKKLLFLLVTICVISSAYAQSKEQNPDPKKKVQIAEASCGQCKFGLKGKGCNLAVRIDGKSYFVDGTSIDEHGDAHAEDGFCNAIRKAEVQGEVVNNRFKATYFKLVKDKKEDQKQ